MKVQWRPAAIADVQAPLKYIKYNLKNPSATRELNSRIFNSISLLRENPYMEALLSLKFDLNETVQYRYLIVSKQIVFYEVIENTIEIIRVLDARTDYLSVLFTNGKSLVLYSSDLSQETRSLCRPPVFGG